MPPRWARAADGAAVAACILGFFVLLVGGVALHAGPWRLRAPSASQLFFVAAALVAIRHAAHSAAPLHRRLARALRPAGDGSAAAIVGPAIASRAVVLLAGYFAVVTIGVTSMSSGFEVSPRRMVNLPARFDAAWYASIALEGYYFEGRFDTQQNLAFFPAFPLLERVVGYPFGAFAPALPRETRLARLLWAGVAVSFAAFGWAAWYFWRLARDTIGEPRASAAVALLGAYPFAVFFSAAYTESLFLLGSVAAIYHFRRRELFAAAIWGALVGLTRPNGCFLSVVLALLVAESRSRRSQDPSISRFPDSPIPRFLLVAAVPGAAMLAFSAYIYHLSGNFFGWARLHEAWGRSYAGLAPAARAVEWMADEGVLRVVGAAPYDTLNGLALAFVVGMLWPVWRRLGVSFTVFLLINVVPPLLAGGLLSMGRLTATLFPVFLALAATVSPRAIPPLVTGFAVAQGLAAVLFFTWRPLF